MNTMNENAAKQFRKALNNAATQFEDRIEDLARLCLDANASKTQISQLEQMGLNAQTLGDITAFVKRQAGKDALRRKEKQSWMRDVQGRAMGPELVAFFDEIKTAADQACEQLNMPEARNDFRVKLAAICLRNLNSSHLYQSALNQR